MLNYADPVKLIGMEFMNNFDDSDFKLSYGGGMTVREFKKSLSAADNIVPDVSSIMDVLSMLESSMPAREVFKRAVVSKSVAYSGDKDNVVDIEGLRYSPRAMQLASGQAIRSVLGSDFLVVALHDKIRKMKELNEKLDNALVILGAAGSGKTFFSSAIESNEEFNNVVVIGDARRESEIKIPKDVVAFSCIILIDPNKKRLSELKRLSQGGEAALEGLPDKIKGGDLNAEHPIVIVRHNYDLNPSKVADLVYDILKFIKDSTFGIAGGDVFTVEENGDNICVEVKSSTISRTKSIQGMLSDSIVSRGSGLKVRTNKVRAINV